MILLIDNYDSFSYNLYQLIGSLNPDITVIRNDEKTTEEIADMKPDCIILSPGPGRPADAGVCEDVVRKLGGKIPLLGVCLGHQAICEVYGAEITYARELMHGKQSEVELDTSSAIFKNLDRKVLVGRYHSLAAAEDTLPASLKEIARAEDGEVMAVADEERKIYGLQFHPESIMTPSGPQMLQNFLEISLSGGAPVL
ncbi:anthranilate synthase component II [Bilifractor porci]|uniref:Aminodeoxychorismate/anthranilate synthase component II n=1 Tax=Bilifractor porci TaxID=2606636 RepID=A0A7X2PA61_9FIRM|nr:aminodeoxychorismate/anthranilate synthase component II [Bilifractor porci]MST83040.1 aminodeoxychorismate/anthranilate synthase component II [Bilifractor porci]